jgi:MYXO-CTERM domain-containing protein
MRSRGALAVVCLVVLASCTERGAEPRSSTAAMLVTPPAAAARVSAARGLDSLPFDARGLVQKLRHGWRFEAGGEATVADPRYEARVGARGVRFLPARRIAGRPEQASRPLEVSTRRVLLGGRALFSPARAPGAFRDRGRRVERGLARGLREIFEAGDGRLEQRWVLEELPATRGELVIEVALSGMAWDGATRRAHLFRDRGNREVGVSYGEATARDARGATLTVLPERIAGGLKVRLPASFLETARAPLVIDPVIGAEFSMDTALARNSAEDQLVPRAATSGTEYLVVWHDYRVLDGRYHIYGARVSAAGALLDPTGIEISTSYNNQQNPDVAWGGGTYLVAWEENGTLPATVGWDIYGSRVSSAGVVQDPGGIKIASGAGERRLPRVEYGGNQFLVVWHWSGTGSTSWDIGGARVTPAGSVLDTTPIAISSAAGTQQYPELAANGGSFLCVWEDNRTGTNATDVYGARIAANGTVSDATGIVISNAADHQYRPNVASNGSNWMVTWYDRRDYNITGFDIFAARVAANGTVGDPNGIAVHAYAFNDTYPRIVSDGTDYLILWNDGSPVVPGNYGGRWVKADGTMTGTAGFEVQISGYSDLVFHPSSSGNHFFIPRAGSALSNDVLARRVLGTGVRVDQNELVLSMAYNAQYYPAVAFDGTNYLVVWSDTRNWATTGFDIYGVRVSASGTVLDPNGLAICTANGNQTSPDVDFDGTNFFVVWEDRRPGTSVADVYGSRIAKTGAPLDGQGVQLSGAVYAQITPRVAFDNYSTYLVVWEDWRSTGSSNQADIYGVRVRASDAFVFDYNNNIPIAVATPREYAPAVAYDGQAFLVVWGDERTLGTTGRDIYGGRVGLNGTVLDPGGKAVSTVTGHQEYPDILWTGTSHLVVWQDGRTSANGVDIYAGYLSTTVVPASATGFAVHAGAGDQYRPRLSQVGKAPLVLFEDRSAFDTASYNIRGARIGGSAVLEAFVVSADPRNEIRPVSSPGAGAGGLIAYMNYDAPLKTVRVVARTFLENCTTAAQCPPGTTCSGGQCVPCNTNAACGPTCVACAAGTYCDGTSCQPCTTSAHCGPSCVACGGSTPFCNGTSCVECLTTNDCAFGKICVGYACVAPPPDQGVPDLPVPDQGVADLPPPTPDLPATDASAIDGTTTLEAATAKEAGAKEASLPDLAPSSDAVPGLDQPGPGVEAGPSKDSAAVGPDLGSTPGGDSGCNCALSGESSPPAAALLALLAFAGLLLRRRRW